MKRISIPVALLVFGLFFSGMPMFPVPVADAAVCSSVGGACKASCSATETSTADTCATGVCCVASTATATSVTISNPLGYTTVQDMLGKLLDALQGIIVTLSLVFIVIGAVLYIVSAGDEGRIKTAKAAITASMIGLAIGIAAPSFLKEISSILGWTSTSATVTAAPTLLDIIQNVLNFLLSLVGVLAIVMLVWGGMMYLTSGGDEKRADSAKSIVKWAIIGIAVALGSLVLVTQVANLF